jgi:hypothetical protein
LWIWESLDTRCRIIFVTLPKLHRQWYPQVLVIIVVALERHPSLHLSLILVCSWVLLSFSMIYPILSLYVLKREITVASRHLVLPLSFNSTVVTHHYGKYVSVRLTAQVRSKTLINIRLVRCYHKRQTCENRPSPLFMLTTVSKLSIC